MGKKKEVPPDCAACELPPAEKICYKQDGQPGRLCPSVTHQDALEAANAKYQDPEMMEFARQASLQEASCYANRHQQPYVMQPTKTRIQEICEFAHRMGYQRLGLAFCVGLTREAMAAGEIFKAHGLTVVSAICKAGSTPKEFLGLSDEDKIYRGTRESMCNPVFQAEIMNRAEVDMNVLLGLCVGHDSLFLGHAKAPCTILAVKDRVTGHNPLAAIYNSDSYYKKLKMPELLGKPDKP